MGFYDLPSAERASLAATIQADLLSDMEVGSAHYFNQYFANSDTYIRKAGYLGIGKIYKTGTYPLTGIIQKLEELFTNTNFHVRQTVVNAAGEIGKTNFEAVVYFFDTGLFDQHHTVRNAVIGSVKKMGEKNPVPVLEWAGQYLEHPDKEIRREICHGIELRGRTHPQDILPMLQQLQFDKTARVRNTLVHVIGQISYKKGCLETVITHLRGWENKDLVDKAIEEIIDVHYRYRNFSVLTQAEAIAYIRQC
jgi:hypothetical protein